MIFAPARSCISYHMIFVRMRLHDIDIISQVCMVPILPATLVPTSTALATHTRGSRAVAACGRVSRLQAYKEIPKGYSCTLRTCPPNLAPNEPGRLKEGEGSRTGPSGHLQLCRKFLRSRERL